MNAREALQFFEGSHDAVEVVVYPAGELAGVILSALSLLAAAEANDGTTPETDRVCITPIMADACTPHKWDKLRGLSRTLELSRNGLAAEVRRLKEAAASVKRFADAMHLWIDRVLSCVERAEHDIGGESLSSILKDGGPLYEAYMHLHGHDAAIAARAGK